MAMVEWTATIEVALSSMWKVVDAGHNMHGIRCQDISIVTTDDKEVVGCSEWLRADREVLEHIVKLHNENLTNSLSKKQW